jgi:RNA polymerase sigma-70 factor (ECF subfamily)
VARQRLGVGDYFVSRKPALRPEDTGEHDRRNDRLGDRPMSALPLAFDQVFRVHAPYVGALVLKLIGRPGYVDDVVQDVFIQAHRGLAKLRDPDAVRPWLRRIAVRRARRWLRKRWVLRWFRELDVDAETQLVDASASPEERAQVTRVYRSLERLPKDERLVWVLRLVEGETLEAIAEMLGCSVSTVQRRLRAAQAAMGELR